ncbi:MAG: phospholipid/cholesterol/gamma-HCH transport system substrate-binding protein [Actinomycetota bacterium]|jgi:phospholipid/cholesterol/gamma-HCH transport system substrate-binding protein|nr:phospholipid/cholesterol/gamma-HCH transport system substrate-binding protein [Actinomycetota bacterium]
MSIKNFRERSPLIVGIISIMAIMAGTTFAFFIDKIPSVKQAYDVTADFKDAAGLQVENQVRVAGIKVGVVSDIQLQQDHVEVTMEIDNGIEIPNDAFAEIKLATILGTKFVDIEAKGGAPFLVQGDNIPVDKTSIPYEIYQAANQGTNLVEDLDGPALNDMLVELTKLTKIAQDDVGSALEGLNSLGHGLNEKDDELRSLLTGADDLTKLLSNKGDEIVRLIDSSNEVLASLARKRESIQSLLVATKQMAGTVTAVLRDNRTNLDTILTDLHDALVVLDRNVEHLDVALKYAGDSSRYFGSIFTQGRWGDIYSCALVLSQSCENDE